MKSRFSFFRISLPLLLFVFVSTFSVVHAQDEYAAVKNWETFDFAHKSIGATDISALSIEDLKLVRGIVFGKHSRDVAGPAAYVQNGSWSPRLNERM